MTQQLLDAALSWHDAGCCVVPAAADGTKKPWSKWKQYQTFRSTPEALEAWFAGESFDGLGLVCGEVSGNLEMFEIEGRAAEAGMGERLAELMRANDLGDLWRRITDGYLEQTPSGGYHWLLRIDGTCKPPTKLANATNGDCLIETKGEGGFTIVAPSGGRTHPSGMAWVVKMGSFGSIPTVTELERDSLYAIATMLDETPPPVDAPRGPVKERQPGEIRPGDDYNDRVDWKDLLTDHGWGYVLTFATGGRAWCRPGKKDGISATTGRNDGDNLYVFSSSTSFDQNKPYTKFAAYTLLEHGGDYSAAARALAAQGYGTPPTRTIYAVPDFDGTAALAPVPATIAEPGAQPAPEPLLPFAGLDLDRLNQPLPPLDWQIHGRMTRGSLTLLGSKPGIGKSWLAQSAALAVSSGTTWLGHDTRQGRVLYLDAENGEHLVLRRLIQLGADTDALGDRLRYVTESMVFPDSRDTYRLRRTLQEFTPDLVIVDTLASIAPTAEAGTEEASTFLSSIWHAVRDSGSAMLLLCHLRKVQQGAGKDDPLSSFRGAGHLVGAAARAWVLDPVSKQSFVLRDVKPREFPACVDVKVALVDDGDGEQLRTSVVVEGEVAAVEDGYDAYLSNALAFIDAHPTGEAKTGDLLSLSSSETTRTLERYLERALGARILVKKRRGYWGRAGDQFETSHSA